MECRAIRPPRHPPHFSAAVYKHSSWLNIAEIELSVFTRQCLDRRIPDQAMLRREAAAWSHERNAAEKRVDWQFTTAEARVKLKRCYPQFQMC